jgi:hypothetical protein
MFRGILQRRRIFIMSGFLLILSACAIEVETFFFTSWPLRHVSEWFACINAAKVTASLGVCLALAGNGWRRLAFVAIGVIELWITWPLGTLG